MALRRGGHLGLFALGVATLLSACRTKPAPPARTEPWLASAQASASARPLVRRLTYRLMRSRVDLDLSGKQAAVRGKLDAGSGELDVDLDDLSHTTGAVSFDLTTLVLLAPSGETDTVNTLRARQALELAPGLTPEKRATFGDVSFRISQLEAGRLVAAPSEPRVIRRRELSSAWSVRGELGLHGLRAPSRAEVALTLVPAPDPAAPPAELLIRSRRPLVVELATHDVRPRDGRGVVVAKEQAVLGDSVGREARVTFELTFVPRP